MPRSRLTLTFRFGGSPKNGNASVTVPGIGVLTVTEADVDKLYNYIIR